MTMPSLASHSRRVNVGARGSSPDCGHAHSAGFAHEPRASRSNSRTAIHKPRYSDKHEQYLKDSWEELVETTPREDAGVSEVRTWVLKVFHRRCHPDPENSLSEFRWQGRDLHLQRRYLALRLRFRGEPYGYMIAHDIHDAVKESRKRARRQEKESKKRAKTQLFSETPPPIEFQDGTPNKGDTNVKHTQKGQVDYAVADREPGTTHLTIENQPLDHDSGTSEAKTKKKLAKILTMFPRTTAGVALPSAEDPFRDPTPDSKRTKVKAKKIEKKGKAKTNIESLNDAQDPFRDPEPMCMRLIDADDFRL
ncbi:hypothetical protein NUW58_g8072 [Xylaria curta]|uniref:Uncharacterized protein n=1 Tax=Xylaria curta TaxID=42375 RepID=A0ACC1NB10_9PEZI|nr:hypothetical protein NUW58_g8072 [Xylaria curta]